MSELCERLLGWYQKNQRDLPWRQTHDPYYIWVSEIMLQQTRVEAVVIKYQQFIEAFPTVADLSKVNEDDVLQLWQGLGYYRRARNLYLAACKVAIEYGGQVPQDYATFRQLPGVGEYTANAVFSIAYQQPYLAMDGNLLRVSARLFAVSESITKLAVKKQLTSLLKPHLDLEKPGDFNQALMDLSSAVCVPKNPRCHLCPLVFWCQAYKLSVVDLLPVRGQTKEIAIVPVTMYLYEDSDHNVLVRKRKEGDFLQGLWELPWVEQRSLVLQVAEPEAVYGNQQPDNTYVTTYTFSHKQWQIEVKRYRINDSSCKTTGPDSLAGLPDDMVWNTGGSYIQGTLYEWMPLDKQDRYPMATVFRHVFSLVYPKANA